jgi:hypothetical protein
MLRKLNQHTSDSESLCHGSNPCEAGVNDLGFYIALLLDTHHDVAWFDISVDKVSLDRVLPLKLFSEYPFYL